MFTVPKERVAGGGTGTPRPGCRGGGWIVCTQTLGSLRTAHFLSVARPELEVAPRYEALGGWAGAGAREEAGPISAVQPMSEGPLNPDDAGQVSSLRERGVGALSWWSGPGGA
jgi:hypothetical protein